VKLNIGCGSNKIEGFINIDTEESCHPDLIHNLMESPLPYENGSVDEIVFFHCIEHIRKIYHRGILLEFSRLLKYGGKLLISYPNFWECAQRWHQNTGANRKFWEATLYGRQLYETDYHVCAMNPDELCETLYTCGFENVSSYPEPLEIYNTITFATRANYQIPNYEDVIATDMRKMVIEQ
jgi:SAM-dependent methyltransferase